MAPFTIKVPPVGSLAGYVDCTNYELRHGRPKRKFAADHDTSESYLDSGRRKRSKYRDTPDYFTRSIKASEVSSDVSPDGSTEAAGRRKTKRVSRPDYVHHLALGSSDDSDARSNQRKRPRRDRLVSYPKLTTHKRPARSRARAAQRYNNGSTPANMTDQFVSESEDEDKVKVIRTKEVFKEPLGEFSNIHDGQCTGCEESHDILLGCQGCTSSYHQACLGFGKARQHVITKLADNNHVFQCRSCVGVARTKELSAPNLGECQSCRQLGTGCGTLEPGVINDANWVLFRCFQCSRAWHRHHLPPKATAEGNTDEQGFAVNPYDDLLCVDCADKPAKLQSIVAWRPIAAAQQDRDYNLDGLEENDKEYLIKWAGLSYRQVKWMPGVWVWGVAHASTRQKFAKTNPSPILTTEDAIPDDFLRIESVLDVEFNVWPLKSESALKGQVTDVKSALIKFEGLGYDEVVWEQPPDTEDQINWPFFERAYLDWVRGKFIKPPAPMSLKRRTAQARQLNFDRKLKLSAQLDELSGGELMPYQVEGVNWLYKKWLDKENAILADEMGLGKTVQLIGFMATLFAKHQCWPFLVVVPNSTCPNWKREIQNWCPAMRVVTFFGDKLAKESALRYEFLPKGAGSALKCHVVVASYETLLSDLGHKVLSRILWAGLIIDEGQRLKNDGSLSYKALQSMDIEFRVLVSGTPLQNNARELYNLLQFLDETVDAKSLADEFKNLKDEVKIKELHSKLQPVLLRRTKIGTLGQQLPPISTTVIPLNMTELEVRLSKEIMQSDDSLAQALAKGSNISAIRYRGNTSNIVMALRQCMSHPHNNYPDLRGDLNIIEDSSKFRFLSSILPKLKAEGHRVLIFSQFIETLDRLETLMAILDMNFARLDGHTSTRIRQKYIDAFNAEDSELAVFLLSTRAGGIGINLATADTIVIMDPDFNPHQDIQALSRAHRLGQKRPVLAFQLMVKSTVEEKLLQRSRQKLALGDAIVEKVSEDAQIGADAATILEWGAKALFTEEDQSRIPPYDNDEIERLLDRSRATYDEAENPSEETILGNARIWTHGEMTASDMELGVSIDQINDNKWRGIFEKQVEDIAAANAKQDSPSKKKRSRQAKARKSEFVDLDDSAFLELLGPIPSSSPEVKKKRKYTKKIHGDDNFVVENEASSRGSSVQGLDDPTATGLGNGTISCRPGAGERQEPLVSRPISGHFGSLIRAGDINTYESSIPLGAFAIGLMDQADFGPIFKSLVDPHTEQPLMLRDANGDKIDKIPAQPRTKPCFGCLRIHPVGDCLKYGWPDRCLCHGGHYLVSLECFKKSNEILINGMSRMLDQSQNDAPWVRAKAKNILMTAHNAADNSGKARDLMMKLQLILRCGKEVRSVQHLVCWIVIGRVTTIQQGIEWAERQVGEQARNRIFTILNSAVQWQTAQRAINHYISTGKPLPSAGSPTPAPATQPAHPKPQRTGDPDSQTHVLQWVSSQQAPLPAAPTHQPSVPVTPLHT